MSPETVECLGGITVATRPSGADVYATYRPADASAMVAHHWLGPAPTAPLRVPADQIVVLSATMNGHVRTTRVIPVLAHCTIIVEIALAELSHRHQEPAHDA